MYCSYYQYARLIEKKQLKYLSRKACVITFEYKHMQRIQKTIQRIIQRLKRIDVYRCIFIWFIHMYCSCIERMYKRMVLRCMFVCSVLW